MSGLSIALVLLVLTVVACGIGLWKGGPGERWAAAGTLGVLGIQAAVVELAPQGLAPSLSLACDAMVALLMLALALRYTSPWLGAMMFFYASQFALHSYFLVMERPSDVLHAIINDINLLGIDACLLVGTLAAWRRRARVSALSA